MAIPAKITAMPEPLKTLIMMGIKMAGTTRYPDAIGFVEEQMTMAQAKDAELFLKWLNQHDLPVGHGTVDLRWHEFKHKREPASQEDVRDWLRANEGR